MFVCIGKEVHLRNGIEWSNLDGDPQEISILLPNGGQVDIKLEDDESLRLVTSGQPIRLTIKQYAMVVRESEQSR